MEEEATRAPCTVSVAEDPHWEDPHEQFFDASDGEESALVVGELHSVRRPRTVRRTNSALVSATILEIVTKAEVEASTDASVAASGPSLVDRSKAEFFEATAGTHADCSDIWHCIPSCMFSHHSRGMRRKGSR